jgi:hypothetical protein
MQNTTLRDAMNDTRLEDENGMRLPFIIKFCSYDEKRKEKSGTIMTMTQCMRVKPPGAQEDNDIITFTTPDRTYPVSVHLNLILEVNGKYI